MVKSTAHSPLDGLVDLACRDGVDVRPTLLRVITDLYVQKASHTAEEETQYVELALGLIGAVDEPTRAAVAARLSGYANAPQVVLQRLAAATAEQPVAAQTQPRLPAPPAPPHAASQDPRHDLIELFFSAGPVERRLILINLDVVAEATPPPAPVDAVIRRLETTALQHDVADFARMLERGLSIGRDLATRIVQDPSGEGIVVAAKALGMQADVLQRILLFLNPAIGQSVERVFELAQLYESMTWTAAEHMVAIWRQSGERIRPRQHAPVLWDDERSNARTRTTPARHRGLGAGNTSRPLPRTGSKPSR